MATAATSRKILLVLLLVVLLPALFYSGYELSTLTTGERLMGEIYRQQLDAILFSLNQHAWDVASSWASTVNGILIDQRKPDDTSLRNALQTFLGNIASVDAVALLDSTLREPIVVSRTGRSMEPSLMTRTFEANQDILDRLNRYRSLQYRKLEPLLLVSSDSSHARLALVFAATLPAGRAGYVAIFLDGTEFVTNVFAPRLRDAAGEEFSLAVFRKSDEAPLYATSPVKLADLKERKDLWLFPGYALGIKPAGGTIEDLVRERFLRNLLLILLLDLVIIGGVWFAYRSIRREMELIRMKSAFVSNVSHELRTPLALIRMFAETLEMGRIQDDAARHEYYATIVSESERLTRLVNNILDFSRMEAGKKQYRKVATDLNETVAKVLRTYDFHLKTEGITPIVQLEPGLLQIEGDPEAIEEALINVIDNAVKYSPSEKYLRVTTRMDGGWTSVEVEDHGIGIAPAHREKIFETFYRVSTGLVHETRGSGLGLSLVKHIMAGHHGKVTVTSTPGKGSTFHLLFPAAPVRRIS